VVEDILQQAAHAIVAVDSSISSQDRAAVNGHRGGVLWLTGLSGAGKSTLAMAAQAALFARDRQVAVLDGDNLRHGLNRDLGFSDADRAENIRRIAEVAKLMSDAGLIVLVSAISPRQHQRDHARTILGDAFHEIFVQADLATCEARDPKGLYKRARAGEIAGFTGISAPYEAPQAPQLTLDTSQHALSESVQSLIDYALRSFAA
jgi:bifunctional enzyme CysN/CysC